MKSENNKNLLYDYVNGLLSDNEKTEFEKQLALSVDLQNDLKRVRQYYSLVKSSEQSVVPRNFIDNVHRKAGIFNELPDNGVSHVNLQKKHVGNDFLKSRLKRWFPIEIAGVLATVVILVFIFIPNVNMPENSKNEVYNDAVIQESDEKTIEANKQLSQDNVTTASDLAAPEPVASIDKKKVLNITAPAKAKEKKSDLPGQSEVHRTIKGISAVEQVARQLSAPASPVQSASPASSVSSVTSGVKEEVNRRTASAMYTDKPASEVLNTDGDVLTSTKSEEKVSSAPIRIILRTSATLSSGITDAAPSSKPEEYKKSKTRRSERIQTTRSKTEISESEYVAGKSASTGDGGNGRTDKTEIEALFSEYYIAWEQIQFDDKNLLYRLNGSGLAVKTVVDKLKSAGFIQVNFPDFGDDSVQVELEIYY
jgi:competence protein ComGC